MYTSSAAIESSKLAAEFLSMYFTSSTNDEFIPNIQYINRLDFVCAIQVQFRWGHIYPHSTKMNFLESKWADKRSKGA